MKQWLFLAIFLPYLALSQADTVVRKPDLSRLQYTDIRWAKSEGLSFWFYHKPSGYFFEKSDFETIPLESGEILVYLFEPGIYLLLPDYPLAEPKKEKQVEAVTGRCCVFIRNIRGGFRIYDKGIYVQGLESVGVNNIHQHVYRSRAYDKRYWIEEYDFTFARIGLPVGIVSE